MVRHSAAFVVALAVAGSSVVFAQTQTQTPAPNPPPVRVGGAIKAPLKTKNVPPVYPAIAQAAGKEGVVILELVIDPAGLVQDVTVLRSVPLLDQAAVDAVRQWEYEPTLLNGVAVPLRYTITVAFSLRTADSAASAAPADTSLVLIIGHTPSAQPAPPGPTGASGDPAAGQPPQAGQPADGAVQAPVRVGGLIKAPTKIVDVPPVYPDVSPRPEGVVILELLVAPQGYVQNARVLRSVPELDQAAIDAVMQWVYTPTLLNGVPVPVIYNVTIAFSARQ